MLYTKRLSSQSSTRLATAEATHEATLENELVEAVTVFHEDFIVRVDVAAGRSMCRGMRFESRASARTAHIQRRFRDS
jgi:hypothetical protein